jgi:DNA modification methylase
MVKALQATQDKAETRTGNFANEKSVQKTLTLQGEVLSCTNSTEKECFTHLLFGSKKVYAPGIMRVKKGFVLFLLNLDSDRLYGVFRATSDASYSIERTVWGGKYPYQVKIESIHDIICLNDANKLLKRLGIQRATPIGKKAIVKLLELYRPEDFAMKAWFDFLLNPKSKVNAELRPKACKSWGLLGEVDKITEEKTEEIPQLEATTLWDFPKQSYGKTPKGDNKYPGVTPALIVWNLIWRYTDLGDLVVDPMCGSGTTIDVCKEEERKVIGYDIKPTRPDIIQNDARKIPLPDSSADLVFVDSPYGDNIRYNDDPNCIGKISSETEAFYGELEKVINECHRILKKGRVLGWLIGDQWVKNKFTPVGFRLYERLDKYFETVEIVCVTRRGQSSNTGLWYNRARRLNFFLRGFKYLFIMRKPNDTVIKKENRKILWNYYERRKNDEGKN